MKLPCKWPSTLPVTAFITVIFGINVRSLLHCHFTFSPITKNCSDGLPRPRELGQEFMEELFTSSALTTSFPHWTMMSAPKPFIASSRPSFLNSFSAFTTYYNGYIYFFAFHQGGSLQDREINSNQLSFTSPYRIFLSIQSIICYYSSELYLGFRPSFQNVDAKTGEPPGFWPSM